ELLREEADQMAVYGTIASRFNDDGVTALYQAVAAKLAEHGLKLKPGKLPVVALRHSSAQHAIVPPARTRYLAEIAATVRTYHRHADEQAQLARECQQLRATKTMLATAEVPAIDTLIADRAAKLDARAKKLVD